MKKTKKNSSKEPACFKWLREVRDEITRDTEGLNDKEWLAYMRERGERAMRSLHPVPAEESAARIKELFSQARAEHKKAAARRR